ncbi:CTP synthase [Nitrosarchaeum sp.]|nr:CTP synthase [Nitrosarchaeum sp.]
MRAQQPSPAASGTGKHPGASCRPSGAARAGPASGQSQDGPWQHQTRWSWRPPPPTQSAQTPRTSPACRGTAPGRECAFHAPSWPQEFFPQCRARQNRPAPQCHHKCAARPSCALLQVSGLHPVQLQLALIGHARMAQRFAHTDVGILQFHILAHHRHAHARFAAAHVLNHGLPLRPVRCMRTFRQPKPLHQQAAEALLIKLQRHLVKRSGRGQREHGRFGYIAKQSNLVAQLPR